MTFLYHELYSIILKIFEVDIKKFNRLILLEFLIILKLILCRPLFSSLPLHQPSKIGLIVNPVIFEVSISADFSLQLSLTHGRNGLICEGDFYLLGVQTLCVVVIFVWAVTVTYLSLAVSPKRLKLTFSVADP